ESSGRYPRLLSQSSDSTSRLGPSTEGNDAQSRSGADCEPGADGSDPIRAATDKSFVYKRLNDHARFPPDRSRVAYSRAIPLCSQVVSDVTRESTRHGTRHGQGR